MVEVARGIEIERKVARLGVELGFLVSSRRHVAGPGDQLWLPTRPGVRRHGSGRPLLIEIKATLDPPWRSDWGPGERAALIEAEVEYEVEPMLCWWPPNLGPVWLPREDWPESRRLDS